MTPELISDLHAVFSEHMRDLGTPAYPKQLFASTARAFGNRCRVLIVKHEGRAAAAGLTLRQGNSTEIPWASALRKYNRQSPNMLLYWEAIKAACEDGSEYFDFGRSSPTRAPFALRNNGELSHVSFIGIITSLAEICRM